MNSEQSKTDAASDALAKRMPRWRLLALAALHGSIFGAAARVLPWDDGTSFGLTAGLLALGYFAVAAACLIKRAWIAPVWRAVSWLALAMLTLWGYQVLAGASYLIGLYGGLGQGLSGAAAAAFAPIVLLTLPLAAWGLGATKPESSSVAKWLGKGAGAAGILLISCIGVGRAYASAGADERPLPAAGADLQAALESQLVDFDKLALGNGGARVYVHHGFECEQDPAQTDLATVLVAYQDQRDDQGRTSTGRCVQAEPEALISELNTLLEREGRQANVKLDFISATQEIPGRHALLDGLKLRPGLDGLCQGARCLAPWQLVAHDQFTRFTPVPFIADLRIGTEPGHLLAAMLPGRKAEEGGEMEGLVRIETESFVVSKRGQVQRLVRGHVPQGVRPLDGEHLTRAIRHANRYINAAQLKSGVFRYKLDPYSGKQDKKGFNLPRQAGTTFALCEHGAKDKRTNAVIAKSLRMMSRRAREHGELTFLTKHKKAKRASLGETALPLIAFAVCRERVGNKYDELMGAMARGLLSLQDERGVYATNFDRKAEKALEGPETLFAEGQVVFALSVMEKIAAEDAEAAAKWPDVETLRGSVERAMEHYASDYWTHPLAQFFWIEENWHCLAARASLEHHRHDGYERMCLDYNRYKLRLALDANSQVAPEFLGAYGFGNVIAPHNTATAGLGEGLAAAIEIAHRRGEDSTRMREAMRGVQRFLLAQQWLDAEMFAHKRKPSARGGWSESMVSPVIRIDFVQHAMAALASGRKAIALAENAAGI